MAFILPCHSVAIISVFTQIEAVLAIYLIDYYRLWALGYSKSISADL